jgi:hypothetical protein
MVSGASGDFSSGPAGLLLQSAPLSSSPSALIQVMSAERVSFDKYKKLIPVIQSSKSIMTQATILFATDTVYTFCKSLFMLAIIRCKSKVSFLRRQTLNFVNNCHDSPQKLCNRQYLAQLFIHPGLKYKNPACTFMFYKRG